jgi:putative protease
MKGMEGETLSVAPGSGHRVQIPMQGNLAKGMVARFI